jgi:hypothetical protein
MKTIAMLGRYRRLGRLLLLGLIIGGCGGAVDSSETGGDSHFLRICESSCGGLYLGRVHPGLPLG